MQHSRHSQSYVLQQFDSLLCQIIARLSAPLPFLSLNLDIAAFHSVQALLCVPQISYPTPQVSVLVVVAVVAWHVDVPEHLFVGDQFLEAKFELVVLRLP